MWFASKGTMDIQLEKTLFSPGEIINGKVTMRLKKPFNAEGVKIALYAYRKERAMVNGRYSSTDRRVYDFYQYLDKKHEYPANQQLTYTFKMAVPDIPSPSTLPGPAGAVLKAFLSFAGPQPLRWYLEASLDIKMAIDLKKKVQIQVAGPEGAIAN